MSLTAGNSHAKGRRSGTRRPAEQAFLDHYLKRLDPEVAASFTETQRQAIHTMFGGRGITRHAVEVRRSLPLPGGRRFYLVFLCGRERRGITRLHGRGAGSPVTDLLWYLGLGAICLVPVLALLYTGLT